jgi:hypothetical protein
LRQLQQRTLQRMIDWSIEIWPTMRLFFWLGLQNKSQQTLLLQPKRRIERGLEILPTMRLLFEG